MPTRRTKAALLGQIQQLQRYESEVGQVHALLDTLKVPRRVSTGAEQDDSAHDRLLWLLHRSVGRQALEELCEQRDLGNEAIDRLKKMAKLYEDWQGPMKPTQTHPWLIVRWVKENLR